MPLTPCTDCGREVSSAAETCPQCGRPKPAESSSEPRSTSLGCAILAILAILSIALYGAAGGYRDEEHEACVGRGIAYFKEIDSYPRLSDGRLAKQVAEERCHGSLTAF